MADIRLTPQGSALLLVPCSDAALAYLAQHFPLSPRVGCAVVLFPGVIDAVIRLLFDTTSFTIIGE